MPAVESIALPRARWFMLFLAAVLLAVSVQYTVKAMGRRSAIIRWQSALEKLDAGEDIYQRYLHPNSPMLVMLLQPLTFLPPVAGALVWFYVKLALTVIAFVWVFRLVEEPGRPWAPWAVGLTILLSLRPVQGDLTHGNVNLFILFLVIAALTAYRHEQDVLAGVVLALAIACKVTPALFVPYFLWKRAWHVLAGCLLGLALFLWPGLVPAAILGWDRYAALVGSWADVMIRPYLVSGVVFYSEHNNQSLPGLLFRLFTDSASFSTYVKDVYTPLEYHNILSLPGGTVRWLVKACMGLFAGLIVWTCRTPTTPRGGRHQAAEFALVTLGMLLFSERTWKHHCVTLVLPFAVVCYHLATAEVGRATRRYLLGTLGAAALLMATTASGFSAWGNRVANLAEVYGAYVGVFVILTAALAVVLCQRSLAVCGSAPAGTQPQAANAR